MTRKEALDKIQQDKYKGAYGEGDYYASYAEDLIDEIYNDFENRICKNCKYGNNFYTDINCTKLSLTVESDFSCNKFERS